MTSPMTSAVHKVGQILRLLYFHQYFSYSIDRKHKFGKWSWLSCWYIGLPLLFPVKTFVATSKWQLFWKFWNIKNSFNLTSDINRASQIMQRKYFSWWWCHQGRHRATWKLLSISMLRSGWLLEQDANIVIVFVSNTCLRSISINNAFQNHRSIVNVIVLDDLAT